MKAVLFDLGDTLVKVVGLVEVYHRILSAHGMHHTREEITRAHEAAGRLFGFELMKTMSDEYWIKRNNAVLEKLGTYGREDLAREIAGNWWDYADVALYSDAKETLARLKQRGIKIGIITNGLQTDFDKIMAKAKLDPALFDVAVTVSTINRMKPEREIFQYALDVLKVAANETLFIGDTVEYDYEGAKNAGLKALLIDRQDKINGDVEKIRDLREILPLF